MNNANKILTKDSQTPVTKGGLITPSEINDSLSRADLNSTGGGGPNRGDTMNSNSKNNIRGTVEGGGMTPKTPVFKFHNLGTFK